VEGRCKATDAFLNLPICETLEIAIDDLLIPRMQERCVPQLLEEQRILIGGFGDLNQPPDHGGLLLTSCTFSLVASAILNERIAWVAVLPPRSYPERIGY
jgi:hypothetical protein